MMRAATFALWGALTIWTCSCSSSGPRVSDEVDAPFVVDGARVPAEQINARLERLEGFTSRGGRMKCAYVPLGQDRDRVFVHALCIEFIRQGDTLVHGSGLSVPAALRVAFDEGPLGKVARITSHETPGDGGDWSARVERILGADAARRYLTSPAEQNARGKKLEDFLRTEAAARLLP